MASSNMNDEDMQKLVAGIVASLQQNAEKGKRPPRPPRPPRQPLVERQESWKFNINWDDLYNISNTLKPRLLRGKLLKKKHKLEMVKRLVTQVRENAPHATRDIFRDVMKQMKQKHAVSFAHEPATGKLPNKSMCKRMQDKFDNDRRPKRRTTTETEAPALKAAYGCKRWRLYALPDGETKDSLESTQQELAQYYEDTRPSRWDWQYIESGMEKTYYLQRADINKQALQIEEAKKREKQRKAKQARKKRNGRKNKENEESRAEEELEDDVEPVITTTEEIRDRWPFLFEAQGMLLHFKLLTGVDLMAKVQAFLGNAGAEEAPGCDGEAALLEEAQVEEVPEEGRAARDASLTVKADRLRLYLSKTNKKGNTKRIRKNLDKALQDQPRDCAELTATIILLLNRFEEERKSLWFKVDADSNEITIRDEIDIPKTPRLVIAGENVYNPQTIFVTQDCAIQGTASSFLEGLCMLFAAYFVFNLEYDADGQTTLEFLQRHVVGINPPRGNKRPPKEAGGQFSSYTHHHHISKLLTAYQEYFAELQSSSTGPSGDEED